MNSRNPILTALLAGIALGSSATAATNLITTNFDSLSDGAVTAANLNGVTTGGTWAFFNPSGNATVTASTATGPDVAINFDDSGLGAANTYETLATLSLGSAATLSDSNSITVTTKAAVGRADGKGSTDGGTDRKFTYLLQDSAGADLINLTFWYTGVGGTPVIDDSFLAVNGGSANSLGVDFQFGPDNWLNHTNDAGKAGTVALDVELTLYETTFDIDFGSYSATGLSYAGANNGTLGSFDIGAAGNGSAGNPSVGGYLDDLTITQVPEPSAALLGGLGLLALLRRRR